MERKEAQGCESTDAENGKQHSQTHRNRGAPWPPGQSISVDGHNAAAYPANPELQGSPSADSLAGQSAPSAFAFAWRVFKIKNKCYVNANMQCTSLNVVIQS